ncbi:hypothetical protein ACFLXY_05945 [Chloroflexota bacterium]
MDAITVVIFFILLIPFVAQYLRKAKFPGAEFVFRDEIRETEKLVRISVEQAEESDIAGTRRLLPFETFQLSNVKDLVKSDPVLSLAALRIEIERKLSLFVGVLGLPSNNQMSASRIVRILKERDILSIEQVSALQKIINMCNKAIHGVQVSESEAIEIINLTEELNGTFSIGYSIDFSPNIDYEKYRLLCEWEHCIEWMPLTEEPTEYSCPVFGHNCPGGTQIVSNCNKAIDDIPRERFSK